MSIEHSTRDPGRAGERCYMCGGSGRRSSFVLAAGHEIEGTCPDCSGTGVLSLTREGSTGNGDHPASP